MEKTLYRNEHDKWIAGVSSGLADYLQIDVKIVRLLFCLSIPFLAGTGLLIYIVLWIIAPVNNDPSARFKKFNDFYKRQNDMFNSSNVFTDPSNAGSQTKWNTPNVGPDFKAFNDPNDFDPLKKSNDASRTIVGLILLIVGVFLMLRFTFDVIPHWFSIWKIWKLWPIAIIALGISLIFRKQRKTEWEKFNRTTADAQKNTAGEESAVEAKIVEEDKDSNISNP
jgi:phage shock protein C